ncbi:MAG: PHP domain-containing protein [Prolixibacteraceae bacterium]|nr:PHP domain-containing protein [Prolixibacteraceae bacterium]
MRADLHFHSKYSDGFFWPDELVNMAYKKGIEIVALTDHDTFEGVSDFIKATTERNIIGIPAIEIDFIDNTFGFKSELLGYFPEGDFEKTFEYISQFQILRRKIVDLSLQKAEAEFNFHDLDIVELIESKIGNNYPKFLHDKISLTKPDVFNYFVNKKVPHKFLNYQDFKNNFFNDKEFVELSFKPEFLNCIELINKDGGFAVLAHPAYQFKKDTDKILTEYNQYKEKLKKAKKMGLWGIEMHSYESIEEADSLNAIFHKMAIECDLNITFGSDFHGENSRNSRQLGCVNGNFQGFKR